MTVHKHFQLRRLTHALKSVLNNMSYKGGVVGGSLGLHTNGLLFRLPNDIDIFYPSDVVLDDSLKKYLVPTTSESSNFYTDIFGNKIKRVTLKIAQVNICVFFIPSEQCHGDFLYNSLLKMSFFVQLPIYAIEAKKQYFKRYGDEKHGNDLVEISNYYFQSQS